MVKIGGLRNCDWTLKDSFEMIIPKKSVNSKIRAQKLFSKFSCAEHKYLEMLNRGDEYETINNAKIDGSDQDFVVDTMYKSWFVRSDIFSKIRVLTDYCSYCYFSNVDELDHYYDKKSYPEVAILPINLVPACESCNQKKKKGSLYFQPYFEDISAYRWLDCTLEYLNVGGPPIPKYKLQRPAKMTSGNYQRLKEQLTDTIFYEMASKSGLDEISSQWKGYQVLVQKTDANVLKEFLKNDAEDCIERFGQNHWKSVLYNSLVDGFDDLIISIMKTADTTLTS